jgi:hypothetical protein
VLDGVGNAIAGTTGADTQERPRLLADYVFPSRPKHA